MESLDGRRFVSILFSITQYIHSCILIIIIITIDFLLFAYLSPCLFSFFHSFLLLSRREKTREERRENRERNRNIEKEQFSSVPSFSFFLCFFHSIADSSSSFASIYNWHENAPSVVDELHRHPQIIIELPIGIILISNISSNINEKQHFSRNNSKQY